VTALRKPRSFAAAAAELKLSKATVSKAVSPSRSGSFDISVSETIDFNNFYFQSMRLSIPSRPRPRRSCTADTSTLPAHPTKAAAPHAAWRQAMSYSISTLLSRNLHDVFGENDPVRRRAAIEEIFTEDCVFYDPGQGVYRGRDEIDRIAGTIKATHSDFRYQPIAPPEESGNGGRIRWVSGRPGEAPAYAGTDFIIARDGRIAVVYLFFDKLPPA
jgi:hypothetical protein